MIRLENQWCLSLKLGDLEDFIDAGDFNYLQIKENAGGLRPIMEISFAVTNDKIVSLLNQGNTLRVQYGINKLESPIYEFEICGDTTQKKYKAGSSITLNCAMYKPRFTNKVRRYTYKDKYSYQCIQEIAKADGFTFDKTTTNVFKTNDRCDWHQYGVTDWTLLTELCNGAYIKDDTFLTWAIDCNNIYLYDIKEQYKKGPKWILNGTDVPMTKNSVNIAAYKPNGDCQGQNASLVGKNMTLVNYDLDSGDFSYPKHTLKSLTTMNTDNININSKNCEDYSYHVTTDERHPNYIEAVNNNLRNNILFSSYYVDVPIAGYYRDFRLLDLVQLKPNQTDTTSEGYYWITAINRFIANNKVGFVLTLSRESAGQLIGKNLDKN